MAGMDPLKVQIKDQFEPSLLKMTPAKVQNELSLYI